MLDGTIILISMKILLYNTLSVYNSLKDILPCSIVTKIVMKISYTTLLTTSKYFFNNHLI